MPKNWSSPYGKGHRDKISTNDPHNRVALRKYLKSIRKKKLKRTKRRNTYIKGFFYTIVIILIILTILK